MHLSYNFDEKSNNHLYIEIKAQFIQGHFRSKLQQLPNVLLRFNKTVFAHKAQKRPYYFILSVT